MMIKCFSPTSLECTENAEGLFLDRIYWIYWISYKYCFAVK
jgi:hypothetical protein